MDDQTKKLILAQRELLKKNAPYVFQSFANLMRNKKSATGATQNKESGGGIASGQAKETAGILGKTE